jgi:hypothetical protein
MGRQVVEIPVHEIQETCDPQGFVEMVRILVGDEAVFDVGGGVGGVGGEGGTGSSCYHVAYTTGWLYVILY